MPPIDQEVLERNRRQGILSSGSLQLPGGPETELKAELDIDALDFASSKSITFSLQVYDTTTKTWNELASSTWTGPSDPVADAKPSLTTNLVPHQGKRTRIVMDTIDRVNVGARIKTQ